MFRQSTNSEKPYSAVFVGTDNSIIEVIEAKPIMVDIHTPKPTILISAQQIGVEVDCGLTYKGLWGVIIER
jgi:hypothetical protein